MAPEPVHQNDEKVQPATPLEAKLAKQMAEAAAKTVKAGKVNGEVDSDGSTVDVAFEMKDAIMACGPSESGKTEGFTLQASDIVEYRHGDRKLKYRVTINAWTKLEMIVE